MKNKYSILLLFTVLCCMGVQCKEEEPDKIEELAKLPPATTKGRNTFGCLINGKAWPVDVIGQRVIQVYYYNSEFFLQYLINNGSFDMNSAISFRTNDIKDTGVFYVKYLDFDKDFANVYYGDIFYSSSDQINVNDSARIQINRLDTLNHILSGTFSFSLQNISGSKQVNVEHGHFDYFYR